MTIKQLTDKEITDVCGPICYVEEVWEIGPGFVLKMDDAYMNEIEGAHRYAAVSKGFFEGEETETQGDFDCFYTAVKYVINNEEEFTDRPW